MGGVSDFLRLGEEVPQKKVPCLGGAGRITGLPSLSAGMALRSRRFLRTRAPECSGVAFMDGGDSLGPGVGMETEK